MHLNCWGSGTLTSSSPIRLLRSRDSQANVVHQIAASAFNGWILRRKSFFIYGRTRAGLQPITGFTTMLRAST